jgi:hypothetical protein
MGACHTRRPATGSGAAQAEAAPLHARAHANAQFKGLTSFGRLTCKHNMHSSPACVGGDVQAQHAQFTGSCGWRSASIAAQCRSCPMPWVAGSVEGPEALLFLHRLVALAQLIAHALLHILEGRLCRSRGCAPNIGLVVACEVQARLRSRESGRTEAEVEMLSDGRWVVRGAKAERPIAGGCNLPQMPVNYNRCQGCCQAGILHRCSLMCGCQYRRKCAMLLSNGLHAKSSEPLQWLDHHLGPANPVPHGPLSPSSQRAAHLPRRPPTAHPDLPEHPSPATSRTLPSPNAQHHWPSPLSKCGRLPARQCHEE